MDEPVCRWTPHQLRYWADRMQRLEHDGNHFALAFRLALDDETAHPDQRSRLVIAYIRMFHEIAPLVDDLMADAQWIIDTGDSSEAPQG